MLVLFVATPTSTSGTGACRNRQFETTTNVHVDAPNSENLAAKFCATFVSD